MHAFAPGDLQVRLIALAHDIRRLRLCGQGDRTVYYRHCLLLGLAQVCQLVHLHIGQVLPAVLKLPGRLAALCVPVVQLLFLGSHLVTRLRIPVPRDQIRFGSLGVRVVALGHRSLGDHDAVQGHCPVAVCRVARIRASSCDNDCVRLSGGFLRICLQRDLFLRGPGICFSIICHLDRIAVLPLHYLVVLQELSHQVMGIQVRDIRIVIIPSLPSLEILHVVTAQERCVRNAAVARIIAYPGVFLVVSQEPHDLAVLALGGISAVGQVTCPVLESRIILISGSPLSGHSPAIVRDHIGHLSCLPGVFSAS